MHRRIYLHSEGVAPFLPFQFRCQLSRLPQYQCGLANLHYRHPQCVVHGQRDIVQVRFLVFTISEFLDLQLT